MPSHRKGAEGQEAPLRVSLKADFWVARTAAGSTGDVVPRLSLDPAAVQATAPVGGVGIVSSAAHAVLTGEHRTVVATALRRTMQPPARRPIEGAKLANLYKSENADA